MNAKLFVANLSWSVSEDDLYELFGSVGDVRSVKIPTRREDGKPRGFAFVEMASQAEAGQAIHQFNNLPLHNRPIVVSYQEDNRGADSRHAGGSTGWENGATRENSKLFVRNIDRSVSESELYEIFGQVGSVLSAKIPMDRDTGEQKPFAFVEMASVEDARTAIERLNGTTVGGREILIDFQDPSRSKSRPPRQGGGGGGYSRQGGGGGYSRSSYGDRW